MVYKNLAEFPVVLSIRLHMFGQILKNKSSIRGANNSTTVVSVKFLDSLCTMIISIVIITDSQRFLCDIVATKVSISPDTGIITSTSSTDAVLHEKKAMHVWTDMLASNTCCIALCIGSGLEPCRSVVVMAFSRFEDLIFVDRFRMPPLRNIVT